MPKERYANMMARALAYLGGECAVCGTSEDLEIDHVNREEKSFDISANTCLSWERIEMELQKCQALCGPHHKEKSDREQTFEHGEGLTGRRNCRCELCGPLKRAHYREYMRQYRAKRKRTAS